jgi:hypothetical protein
MPTSSKEGKYTIVKWCKNLTEINKVLDIGAGNGTYKKLMNKNSIFLNSYWIGVEAWTPYVQKFNLSELYNTIVNDDARTIDYSVFGEIDLVFLGDVLEHMTKKESIKLLSDLSKNVRYAIISIPIVHYPQDSIHNNPYEIHIKDDWNHKEVIDTFAGIEHYVCGKEIGCYFLKFK